MSEPVAPVRPKLLNVSFTLPLDLIAELRKASAKTEIPQAALVRHGIRKQLDAMKDRQAA